MDLEEIKQFLTTDEGKNLVEASESVNGLRVKKDELLSKNVVLNNQLKDYASLGDIETLRALVEKSNKADVKDENVQIDPKLSAQIEHLTNELNSEKSKREQREKALVNSFATAEITSIIAKHKGVPELLNHVVSSRVDAALNNEGRIVLTVKNADGSPMFKNGKEASLEDLISEIKSNQIYGRAFDAEAVQGSGSRPQTTKTVKPVSEGLNLTEIMKKQRR